MARYSELIRECDELMGQSTANVTELAMARGMLQTADEADKPLDQFILEGITNKLARYRVAQES